jgi:hypothetical protein
MSDEKNNGLRIVQFPAAATASGTANDDATAGMRRVLEIITAAVNAGDVTGLFIVTLQGHDWRTAVAGPAAFEQPAEMVGAAYAAITAHVMQIVTRGVVPSPDGAV